MSSVRDGEVGSNRLRCMRKTWKVSGMDGVVASSWLGALDRVSAKCSEDPFLFATAKLCRCRKSIIFCKELRRDPSGRWIGVVDGQYGQLCLISRVAIGQIC